MDPRDEVEVALAQLVTDAIGMASRAVQRGLGRSPAMRRPRLPGCAHRADRREGGHLVDDGHTEGPDDQVRRGAIVASRVARDHGDVIGQAGEDTGERRDATATGSHAGDGHGQPARPDHQQAATGHDGQGPHEQLAAEIEDPPPAPDIPRATNGVWTVSTARVAPAATSAAPISVPASGEELCPSARAAAVGCIGRSVGPAAHRGP